MFNIIFGRKKCNHDKIPANIEQGYCPDCGELIENQWYLVRCKHCKIKRKAYIAGENILPESHFCPNCGGILYEVEKLKKINFIDINFAVLKKEVIKTQKHYAPSTNWVEQTSDNTQKLLGKICQN